MSRTRGVLFVIQITGAEHCLNAISHRLKKGIIVYVRIVVVVVHQEISFAAHIRWLPATVLHDRITVYITHLHHRPVHIVLVCCCYCFVYRPLRSATRPIMASEIANVVSFCQPLGTSETVCHNVSFSRMIRELPLLPPIPIDCNGKFQLYLLCIYLNKINKN